ncbi:DUF2225 domain-containing protein [Bacillus alkalisoli]|uniref:DUF2225 domain-containing protein n=1 Tax=Bacillus alkalisoli TaxID=2011008 RepID=UPI000C249BBA|nr:DUF2225 domain-containing protein [Bacillus alkalisoli]
MNHLYDKNFTCPICDKKHISKKVRSKFIKSISHDSDFCTHYESVDTNPLLYYVNVCPTCGYASSEEFSNYFKPGTKDQIETKIWKHWHGKSYGEKRTVDLAINTYKLAIYTGLLKKETPIVIAGLYLRLAWIYRTLLVDELQEKRFMKLALEQYKDSYSVGDYIGKDLSELRLLYIIGELYSRIGYFEQAIKYFSLVVQHKNRTFETRMVENASNRWFEIREMQKSKKTAMS